MGPNSEYYFDPPADPILELITPKQREWFGRFGTRQGKRFDQFGFPYTTREVYDAFYPGYGSTWPTLHGSIGILWEQAGRSRPGRRPRRPEEAPLSRRSQASLREQHFDGRDGRGDGQGSGQGLLRIPRLGDRAGARRAGARLRPLARRDSRSRGEARRSCS